jgi:hypothetical protein
MQIPSLLTIIPRIKAYAIGSVIIIALLSGLYLHIGILKKENKLLEAKMQSYEIVVESYAQNAEISRKIQAKTDEEMVGNRAARGKLINQLALEKTKQRKQIDEISEGYSKDCLNSKLPDPILDSLHLE